MSLRMYNVVKIYDVYVVANSPQAARDALQQWIVHENLPPSDEVANETRLAATVRQGWRDQKPLVGADVTDEEFKLIEGKTTFEMFTSIYTKRG